MTVIWLPVVILAHMLMCKFVFLESDSGGKFLAITNRYITSRCTHLFLLLKGKMFLQCIQEWIQLVLIFCVLVQWDCGICGSYNQGAPLSAVWNTAPV